MHRRRYLSVVAVGALAGCVEGDGPDDSDPVEVIDHGDGDGDDDTDTSGRGRIDAPATELVLRIEHLGAGWYHDGVTGDATAAESANGRQADDWWVVTRVTVHDGVTAARDAYTAVVEDAREHYGTDTLDVGAEGVLWGPGDIVYAAFRDRNVSAVADVYLSSYPIRPFEDATEIVTDWHAATFP